VVAAATGNGEVLVAHVHEHLVPKPALLAGAGMMVLTVALVAAGTAGLYQTPKAKFAEARASIAVVKEVRLRLAAQPDGTIKVTDAATGALVRTVGANEGGFIHYVLTGLQYSRKTHGLDPVADVRIARYADGRLMVHEVPTGVTVDVVGYGPTQVASFAGLLDGTALPPVPRRM
jgi:putative photosynthetic complex assembly protein